MLRQEEDVELNFDTGEITRGDQVLMTLEEVVFLVGAAVQYNSMAPTEKSEQFVADLAEAVGMQMTPEQFAEIKQMMVEESAQ